MATNGREALELLEGRGFTAFDAVLMDVQMPEMDGMEATAAIRAQKNAGNAHTDYRSNRPRDERRSRALPGGRHGWIREQTDSAGHSFLRTGAVRAEFRSTEIIATKAPSAPSATAGMVLDRSALLDRVEGDMELLGDIIVLFKDDSVRQIAAIREAIGKKEPELVKRAAHTLKGTCGNLGAPDAATTAGN